MKNEIPKQVWNDKALKTQSCNAVRVGESASK